MPGETPENPLHIQEVQSRTAEMAEVLDLTIKILSALYMLYSMWQVAKLMRPELAVQEKIIVGRLQQRLAKPKPPEVHVPREWIAAIYDDTRQGLQ